MKRKLKQIVSTVLCSCLLMTGTAATNSVGIRLNGETADIGAKLINATTYVPFDEASRLLSFGKARVSGTDSSMLAECEALSVSAALGNVYINASGRYLGGEAIKVDGRLYVPIRPLAKAYGAEVIWRGETRSVDLESNGKQAIESGEAYYDKNELYWLSRIIEAEAGAEPMRGKILVGNVVLNRVKSGEFPNDIYSVIFDRNYGVQFTPVANGTIYNTPSKDSIIAAKLCLDSYFISSEAMYFLNPRLSTNFWVPNNRKYIMSVGCHDFYE